MAMCSLGLLSYDNHPCAVPVGYANEIRALVENKDATWEKLGFTSDDLDITDNESQTITLAITPASATEGDGVRSGEHTVSIPGTWRST